MGVGIRHIANVRNGSKADSRNNLKSLSYTLVLCLILPDDA